MGNGRTLGAFLAAAMVLWGSAWASAQSTGDTPPSVAMIDQRLLETAQDPSLDDTAKARIRGVYQQALSELESAARWRVAALDFARRTTEAAAALAELEAAVASAPGAPADISASDGLDALEQRRANVEGQLEDAASRLSEADAEPLRRTSRRAEIRETLADLSEETARIEADLEAPGATDAGSVEADARRALLSARRLQVENRTLSLQRELVAYDAERPLLPHRRELAARDVAHLQEQLSRLDAAVDALRRLDTSQQATEAITQALQLGIIAGDEQAGGPRRVLLSLAAANNGLTARRQVVVSRLDMAEDELNETRAVLAELDDRFTRTRERVSAIGQTGAVGVLLQRHRGGLPDDIERYRDARRGVEQLTRVVQEEMFDLDEQRLALGDIGVRAVELLADPDQPSDEPDEEVVSSVRSMLETQRTYLGLLFNDQARYFDILVQLGTTQGELSDTAETFLRFIDERVLWTRNAEPIAWSDLAPARDAAVWLAQPGQWMSLAGSLGSDVVTRPWRYAPLLGVLLVSPFFWRRCRSALAACGERAAAGYARRYTLTAQGLLLTLAIAAPGPAVAWLLGRRLAAADESGFAQSVAAALAAVAATYVPLEILRQASRPHGLMTGHFRWSARTAAVLRRHLGWFAGAALPLVFVFAAMSSQQEQAWQHALGRLALVVLAIASAVFLSRVLHPAHGVSAELLAANRGDWLQRLRNVWYGVAVLAPLGLAGVALAGYMYAAADLTAKSLETLWLATAAIVAYGMVSRWVLVSRRTLAFRQRRERAQAEEGEVVEPAPDLSQIDAQTRRLIRTLSTAAALGGVWLVWSDMVPALSVLDRVVLWPLDAEPGTEGAFTLEHLGLTLLLAVLTAALARNVPALLEMLLLQLPLQPGSRYALTSMSRYALIFSGALAIFGVLGVTWSSVQWLVAAFGVGLGFGLQEIFANFVSGLLLLMERPVRVGDTITVGGVTGTVTRIRIRATTIQDWDLKELVVPNKDLVTGHLLNWTLSDAANRVTVFVGVAYGSDVEKVTRVLHEIVAATALVLESPEPTVTFEEFGDSALKFSIRAYVREVEDRLPAIHALHTAIAKRFGEEEIEIAFPQMDIHVRSTAPHLRDDPPRPLRLASPSG